MSTFRALAAAASAAAILSGCATTRVDTEWRDPGAALQPLQGKRVLVACRALDEAMRRVCEDEWVRQLEASGVGAAPSYAVPGFPANAGDLSAEMRDAAVARKAVVIASTTLRTTGGTMAYGGGPQVGVGIGAAGGSGGGSFGFGGISIGLPIGGGRPAPVGLGSSTSIVDVGTGKLLWSANAASPTSTEMRGQLADLTRVTIEAMRKAGLI